MDMLNAWAGILSSTVQGAAASVVAILPQIIVALVLIVLGWIVGAGLQKIVAQLINTLKINDALRGAGIDKLVERTGHRMDAGQFLGALVKWFVIAVFFVAALEVLNLTQVTTFLSQVVFSFLPQVIVAVLILLVAAVLADFVSQFASSAARAANVGSAYFIGSVARWAIWILAILTALDQLNVATAFVQTLFTGIVVSISLALGLSFGLGGQQAAARYIDRVTNELSKKHDDHHQGQMRM